VRFDAPRFGEAAGKVYDQLELWPTGRPSPEDTGFDVLGDILCDLSQDDSDSDRFDHQLLRGLTAFSNVVNGYFQEMFITGGRYPKEHPAILNERTIATAREFYSTTPSPTAARVVGKLDMVCISSQSFGLELKDGAKVRGALAAGQIVELRGLLGERVVVLGEAVFRTSGNLLRIDGESIRPAGDESFVWSRIPRPSMRALDVGKLRRRQGPRSGVSAVIGHWPGDESDEEIHAALRELS
ncbi:MAG: hypothetical protein KAW89_06665, partial [Armatimonadetes bacterium]|nr:hypothetical protein [Armatimonadota bacterium]